MTPRITGTPQEPVTEASQGLLAALGDWHPDDHNRLRVTLLLIERQAAAAGRERVRVLGSHIASLVADIEYVYAALDIDEAEWDDILSRMRAARAALGEGSDG